MYPGHSTRKKVKVKMLVKATITCVEELLKMGIDGANIEIRRPMVDLIPIQVYSKVHQECHVVGETLLEDSSAESHSGVSGSIKVAPNGNLVELEEENIFSEQIGWVVEAIQSFRFNWLQCPVEVLQIQLQSKGLEIELIQNNPILFNMLKQQVYNEFRCSYPSYASLLKLKDIKNFRWQLYWLWGYLINSPITINTYERVHNLIRL